MDICLWTYVCGPMIVDICLWTYMPVDLYARGPMFVDLCLWTYACGHILVDLRLWLMIVDIICL